MANVAKIAFRLFAAPISHFPAAVKSSLLIVILFLGSCGSERPEKKLTFEYVFYLLRKHFGLRAKLSKLHC